MADSEEDRYKKFKEILRVEINEAISSMEKATAGNMKPLLANIYVKEIKEIMKVFVKGGLPIESLDKVYEPKLLANATIYMIASIEIFNRDSTCYIKCDVDNEGNIRNIQLDIHIEYGREESETWKPLYRVIEWILKVVMSTAIGEAIKRIILKYFT